MTFENELKLTLDKIKEDTEKEQIQNQKLNNAKDYYISLCRDINNCKKIIEERKKSKQDYSVYTYRLDCLNKILDKYKKNYFKYFNY
jgi:hypothetical protein